MNICKRCKNAQISMSLSGHHITCSIDRRDYSFSPDTDCAQYINHLEEEKKLYLCPKFNECIRECHHKKPHPSDKWCNPESDVNKEYNDGVCVCPTCVEEIKADITFLPEDFEL